MKISGNNPIKPGSVQRKKDPNSASSLQGSDDFLSILGSGTATAPAAEQPISDVQPINTVSALLTLQEMPEDEVANRKAITHSRTTLETLETLRHSLLMGNVPVHVLRELDRMVSNHRKLAATDPKLKEILDDIELRAAVELAKLEMASGS